MFRREPAWRVFAEEYSASTLVESSDEEKTPTYVITPLGARINRLLIVGTLVEVNNTGDEEEPIVRAIVADPTGHFYLNTGQYNKEAGFALLRAEVPSFVAVVGKVHTYEPEPGVLRKYVRPEEVRQVDVGIRNRWIVETAEFTKERIDAMKEALAMEEPDEESLIALGVPKRLASGVSKAIKHYGDVNIKRYWEMIGEALRYAISDKGKSDVEKEEEFDIKALIDSVAEGDDVYWSKLKEAAREKGIPEKVLMESIDRMIRQGVLYERKIGEVLRIDREDW